MNQEIERNIKRIERHLGMLDEEARRLRERIAAATGASSGTIITATGVGTIVAGAGLTGGGSLPGTVTLNVGAGDGIDVGANDVAVDVTDIIDTSYGLTEDTNNIRIDLAAPSGLSFTGGDLQLDDSVAGVGLGIAAKVMSVNVGNGLEISGDDVQVDLAAPSGLSFSGGDLQIDDSVAGGGLGIAAKVVSVNTGTGLTLSGDDVVLDWSGTPTNIQPDDVAASGASLYAARIDHTHGITADAPGADSVNVGASSEGTAYYFARSDHTHNMDENIAPTWTGTHTFQSDIQLDANLDFVGAQLITTTAGNLTISPAADLILKPGDDIHLDPDGDQVIFVNWGAGKSFESDDYVSQTTGFSIAYGASGGHADFRSMYADELHVQAFIADIYQALVGAIIITKSRARLSRDFTIPATTGTGTLYLEDLEGWENTQLFDVGDYVRLRFVDTSGGGLIVTDVWGTVSAYTDLAGGEQSYTFTTTDDGGVSGSVIYTGAIALDYGQTGVGEIRGIWEATVLDGAGAPYSQIQTWETNPWTGGNWTTRVRLGNLDGIGGIGLEYGLWAGQNTSDTYLLLSDSSFEVHGLDVKLYDGGSNTVRLDPSTPSFAMGATLPTGFSTNDGIWMGKDTVYKFRVGDTDGERLAWDGSDLYIYADNDNYIKATGTDLEFYSDGTKVLWMDGSTGALHIDKHGDLFFSSADGLLLINDPWRIERESSTDYVYGTRGEKATLSGALHMEQGRWIGTQAMVYEVATTNLVTNPSFETNTTSWFKGGVLDSITRTSDESRFGLYSLRATEANSAGTNEYVYTSDIAVSAGTSYSASVYLKSNSVNSAVVVIWWYTAGLVYISASTSAAYTPDGAWHRISVSDTSPGTAAWARVVVIPAGGVGTAYDLYIDGAQLEQKTVPTSYCDGSLGNGYSWSGVAHASTSARTASYLQLDDFVGLISENNTLSFRVVVQMPYDYDADWIASSNVAWGAHGADANNRILLDFDTSDNRFEVYINGAVRLEPTAQALSAGDWVDVVVTLDFSSDEYKLYVDGELVDTDTTSLSAPTLVGWTLGGMFYNGTTQGGFTISEYATFDRVLTANEVSAMYDLGRPLVDAGALDKPGIYILDGQFRLLSSQTGQRVEIVPEGVGIYDDSGYTGVARLLGGRVDTTGKVLDAEGDSLGWFGYDGSNNLQVAWYAEGTDSGKITAGAGVLELNSNGIEIEATTTELDARAYKFKNSGGTLLAALYCKEEAATVTTTLKVTEDVSKSTVLNLRSEADTSDTAVVRVYADSGTDQARLFLSANDGLDSDTYFFVDNVNKITLDATHGSSPEILYETPTMKRALSNGGTQYTIGQFVPLSSPLTSTSWDGDSKTVGDNGTIDLSAVFGAPAGIKAVLIRFAIEDETVGEVGSLGPDSTYSYALTAKTQVANIEFQTQGIVPCDSSGDVYFSVTGELDAVYIQIWGYWV